jgi:hypothetical protein
MLLAASDVMDLSVTLCILTSALLSGFVAESYGNENGKFSTSLIKKCIVFAGTQMLVEFSFGIALPVLMFNSSRKMRFFLKN